jgi:hypothetical protein
MKYWVILLVLSLTTAAIAQETALAHQDSHPVLSIDSTWAGIMLILIIGAFFLPAAVIGPIVRALSPQEVPPAWSHDEPPGTSGHHGKSGTVDQNAPEHDHGHGHAHH